MPPVDPAVVKARAGRLRAAGDAGFLRHLNRLVGRQVSALVERDARARAEDFTEVAFAGQAAPGALITGVVASHDGQRARLDSWSVLR